MTEQFEPAADETAELTAVEYDGSYDRVRIARVNLLPSSVLVERRQRQVALYSLGVLVAFLVGLGAVYAYQLGRVDDARAERDRTQAQVVALRDDVAAMARYQRLLDLVENREELLASAMTNQLSWARVLGDLALSFDRQASLIGVEATSTEPDPADGQPADAANVDVTVFDLGEPVAQVEFTGYSVDRFAPGVEEVLERFDEADGMHDAFLATAGKEERGTEKVTNFVGEVLIDESAFTHRYDDGLPEEGVR